MINAAQLQSADWNGRTGAAWLFHQERLDRMLEPFGRAAFDAALPAPGEYVLDIGCGAGTTTLSLARAVGPYGAATGLDISEPLLAACAGMAVGYALFWWTVRPGLTTELAVGATLAICAVFILSRPAPGEQS